MEDYIVLDSVTKRYRRGEHWICAIRDLTLAVQKGQFLAVMGPSGSGKSSLIHLIGGMDTPSMGQVSVAGWRLDGRSEQALAAWRSSTVGFVFQRAFLMPSLSARRNVEVPLMLTRLSPSERQRRVDTALDLVGLSAWASHRPHEMSGGQEQRTAIARAIVADPALLICDEPTGNLDRHTAGEVLQLLQVLNRDCGKTVIVVTHDQKVTKYANRIVYLEKGTMIGDERFRAVNAPASI